MLETILRNQRIILEVLRSGTDVTWLKEEIDERIHYTNEELSKLHQPTVSGAVCDKCDCIVLKGLGLKDKDSLDTTIVKPQTDR